MEEIDIFILKIKQEQEIKDYINKNIYPESLKKQYSQKYIAFPKLEDTILKEFNEIQIENDFKNTIFKLNQIENQIHSIIEIENKENSDRKTNCCPICLEVFQINNYLIPKCGHKICLPCFTKNIIKNNNTGKICCLCREKIITNF